MNSGQFQNVRNFEDISGPRANFRRMIAESALAERETESFFLCGRKMEDFINFKVSTTEEKFLGFSN